MIMLDKTERAYTMLPFELIGRTNDDERND